MGTTMNDPRFDLPMGEWTPIGDGVEIRPFRAYGSADVIGFFIRHAIPEGWCEVNFKIISFYGASARWQVTQERPLTITPIIECKKPGHTFHGFIRDGRWVTA